MDKVMRRLWVTFQKDYGAIYWNEKTHELLGSPSHVNLYVGGGELLIKGEEEGEFNVSQRSIQPMWGITARSDLEVHGIYWGGSSVRVRCRLEESGGIIANVSQLMVTGSRENG